LPSYVIAFLIGITAGLRAFTPLAVVSWAARLSRLQLGDSFLAFLGYSATPYIFTVLALFEIVNDKLPKTPSRKTPPQFIARVLTGALSGAAVGAAYQSLAAGLIAGALGAVAGTLGGAEVRGRLAKAFGNDLPAALLEDVFAVAFAILVIFKL
jgi:uncharacterized membrane protein